MSNANKRQRRFIQDARDLPEPYDAWEKYQARENLMEELVKKHAEGREACFYGSLHIEEDLDDGFLHPGPFEDVLFRCASLAVWDALLWGHENDFYSGGVLIFDRIALARDYRLESQDEEDVVRGSPVLITPYLIAAVTEADLDEVFIMRGQNHSSGRVMIHHFPDEKPEKRLTKAELRRARKQHETLREYWKRIWSPLARRGPARIQTRGRPSSCN